MTQAPWPRRAPSSVRAIAARLLQEVSEGRRTHAAEGIDEACRDHALNKRDRRFLHELVLGVLRRRITIDRILRAYSRTPLEDLDGRVHECLRLSAYQLLFLDRVPPFAAIDESLRILANNPAARAFLNGVLRTLDRECRRVPIAEDKGGAAPSKRLEIRGEKVCFFSRPVFTDPEEDEAAYLSEVHSQPKWLVQRWLLRLGKESTLDLMHRQIQPPPLFVRTNALRIDREALLKELRTEGLRCSEGSQPPSIRVHAPPTELVRTRAFRGGLFTIQDETAMKVAPALDPKPGERVLDLCAAPGGKATHLAELSMDRALILAVDRSPERLVRLVENLRRLGLSSVSVVEGDLLSAAAPPPGPFERILVDAPCSNSGVFGRKPEARLKLTPEVLAELSELQHRLLERAAQLLGESGRMVYSTCSIEEEENSRAARDLLRDRPEISLLEEQETLPAPEGGDGGYLAVFERRKPN